MENFGDQYLRFAWQPHPDVNVSPAVGHLHPGGAKQLLVTALCKSPVAHSPLQLVMTTTVIQYKGQPEEWDDGVAASGGKNGVPEPPFTAVPKSDRPKVLRVFLVADDARYECDLGPIIFKETMML